MRMVVVATPSSRKSEEMSEMTRAWSIYSSDWHGGKVGGLKVNPRSRAVSERVAEGGNNRGTKCYPNRKENSGRLRSSSPNEQTDPLRITIQSSGLKECTVHCCRRLRWGVNGCLASWVAIIAFHVRFCVVARPQAPVFMRFSLLHCRSSRQVLFSGVRKSRCSARECSIHRRS
jgi:hypothetical protein